MQTTIENTAQPDSHIVPSPPRARRFCRLNGFKQPLQRAKRATIVGRFNVSFPKLFLRLRTKFQTSDFPMTLAKWFFIKSAIDSIGFAFYHHH
jgi:hypothetical protein